jgi:VanZ family protein
MNQRRWHIAAALVALLFAAYGSLVPFAFDQQVDWHEAMARARALSVDIPQAVRTGDLIVNLSLLAPVGFFGAAAVAGRASRRLTLIAAGAAGLAVAGSLEFAQLFTVYRTASISDVIGLTLGGLLGAAVQVVWGARIEARRRRLAALSPGRRLQIAVWLYAAGWLATGLLPLLFPTYAYPLPRAVWRRPPVPDSFAMALGEGLLTAVAVAPCGLAAASLRAGLPWRAAVAMGTLAVVLWLDSLRQITPGDTPPAMAWRTVGVSAAFVGAAVSARAANGMPAARWAAFALALWLGVLALAAWAPFDFGVDAAILQARVEAFSQQVPLYRYYWAPPLLALRMVATLVLCGALAGGLARLAGARLWPVVILGLLFFAALEWAQLHLPLRRADPTDVLLSTTGVIIGWLLTGGIAASPRPPRAGS